MASVGLRDRDGIITKEGLIFRVFGYSHPADAYVCDVEYASGRIFYSKDPRAPRAGREGVFYKFYDDEGWRLIFQKYPQYTIYHAMLDQKVIGVRQTDITESRKPEKKLQSIAKQPGMDELIDAMQRVLAKICRRSGLARGDFGVFGSTLHGFHHPKLSDIDLIVYGTSANNKARDTLYTLYSEKDSCLRNEFETKGVMEGKRWRFKHFSAKEFVWHQKRKLIYGMFHDADSRRMIKAEFEPVKAWNEIKSEYEPESRVLRKGWVRIKARITEDTEAPFIPSVYNIQPLEILNGPNIALEAARVVSFMEEFRLQAWKDETVIIEGNLEEVVSPRDSSRQITLTYCPRYYEQTLKIADLKL